MLPFIQLVVCKALFMSDWEIIVSKIQSSISAHLISDSENTAYKTVTFTDKEIFKGNWALTVQ